MEGIISLWSRGCMAKLFVVIAVALLGASIVGALALVVQSQSPDDPADRISVAAPLLAPTNTPTTTPAPPLHPSPMLAPLLIATTSPTLTPASDAPSAAFPCLANQVKGKRRSGIAYTSGQPGYTLRSDVRCFGSVAQAQAAGYQHAKV